jgi:hypothetical protein
MNSVWDNNLRAVANCPQLAYLLGNLSRSDDAAGSYVVTPAKSSQPTLAILTSEGKRVAYHSAYDPVKEAQTIVAKALQNQTHVLLIGLGLGYLLDEICRRLPQTGLVHQITVVEPDIRVFRAYLLSRNATGHFADSRIDWCLGQTSDQFGEFWNQRLDWGALEDLVIIEHAPTLALHAGYVERLKEKIRSFCNRSKGNLVTVMYSGFEFLKNNFRNIGAAASYPGVSRLFQQFKNIPAVIVAAGPSLEKNAHLLKTIKDRFLIVAVDTSFRQLVSRGIRPDIVCAGDPSYLNSLDFVGVENEKDVILLIEPMTHPDILHSFEGPKMVTTFGGGVAAWLQDFREPVGTVTSWGSIATTAFDLTRKLGCDPIIFVGLDLSFQDGRLYARGSYSDDVFYDRVHPYSSLEHETISYICKKGIHAFPQPDGSTLFTDNNMKLYKDWFEDQFRQTPQKVINATEGGIVNSGVECKTLQETIDAYLPRSGPVREILQTAIQKPIKADYAVMTETLRHTMKDLHTQANQVKTGLQLCRKLLNTPADLPLQQAPGPMKAIFEDISQLHDQICVVQPIFSWYSLHQAKFVARHTMELSSLKASPQSTLFAWGSEMQAFFESFRSYHAFQIPLMEAGIQSISDIARKSKPCCSAKGA